jgi:hypothetical protein
MLLVHHACFQECHDKRIDFGVNDAFANAIHQGMMPDVIETAFDVSLNSPLIREPVGLNGRVLVSRPLRGQMVVDETGEGDQQEVEVEVHWLKAIMKRVLK